MLHRGCGSGVVCCVLVSGHGAVPLILGLLRLQLVSLQDGNETPNAFIVLH